MDRSRHMTRSRQGLTNTYNDQTKTRGEAET